MMLDAICVNARGKKERKREERERERVREGGRERYKRVHVQVHAWDLEYSVLVWDV